MFNKGTLRQTTRNGIELYSDKYDSNGILL